MNVEKIILVDGIIQNKTIMGIPVVLDIVEPKGLKNVRRLVKFSVTPDQCFHNTANPSTDAEGHGRWQQNVENADKQYVSAHVYIDDDSIVQILPLDELGYHAGTTNGNNTSIGIEICEDGEMASDKAEYNAQCFGACYLYTFPDTEINKHQDYSGKWCPRVILNAGRWDSFKEGIFRMSKPLTADEIIAMAFDEPDNWIEQLNRLEEFGEVFDSEYLCKYIRTAFEKVYHLNR